MTEPKHVPDLPQWCNSWTVLKGNRIVMETWSRWTAQKSLEMGFEVIPTSEWLAVST
ncbi:hypothetical protein [Phenylobacterium sp.]|uniref:hypothetical protein n=1 Tax=Phenylobacterium sp. TaxID=1871053 RepID=UPI0025EA5152|nr:hypothetical protein [Phenylobacterium sp.]MCA6269182.1 hypothetical protein [Phenylobacterium sp.]